MVRWSLGWFRWPAKKAAKDQNCVCDQSPPERSLWHWAHSSLIPRNSRDVVPARLSGLFSLISSKRLGSSPPRPLRSLRTASPLSRSPAGAAIQSFVRLMRVPLGYDPHNVVSLGIPLQENSYTTWQGRVNYFEQLRSSVAALQDVTSVAISSNGAPPYNGWEQTVELLSKPAASPDAV